MKLRIKHKGLILKEYLLRLPEVRVGAHSSCDIILDDPTVPEELFRIIKNMGLLTIHLNQEVRGVTSFFREVHASKVQEELAFLIWNDMSFSFVPLHEENPVTLSISSKWDEDPSRSLISATDSLEELPALKKFLMEESHLPESNRAHISMKTESSSEQISGLNEDETVSFERTGDTLIVKTTSSLRNKRSRNQILRDGESLILKGKEYTFHAPSRNPSSDNVRVIERPATRRWDMKHGKKQFALILGLLIISILFFLYTIERSQVSTPRSPSQSIQSKWSEETLRVVRFQMGKAREAITSSNLTDAEMRVAKILEDVAPGHPEALALRKEISDLRVQEHIQREKEEAEKEAIRRRLDAILDEALAAQKEGKIDVALMKFQQVLYVDSENVAAKKGIATIEALKERERRDLLRKEEKIKSLTRSYEKGILALEDGKLKQASDLLTPVARDQTHPKSNASQKILKDLDRRVTERAGKAIAESQTKISQGDPLKAREVILTFRNHFPRNAKIEKEWKRIEGILYEQAKKSFQDGIAHLELAEDPGEALDRFEEALRLSPDPKSEYHQKAKSKIEELKLGR